MTAQHPPPADRDVAYLDLAVDLATANVADGGGPFAAVVVRTATHHHDDAIDRVRSAVIATGTNRVTRAHDPTAHAEVEAIRAAARTLGTHDLSGFTLYASCEPCPMCLAAALWARLDRVMYAADRTDAAAAGFDDAALYDVVAGRASGRTELTELRGPAAHAPFEAWAAATDRTGY